MKLTGPKVLALALLVAGQVVVPSLIGSVPRLMPRRSSRARPNTRQLRPRG